MDGGFFLPCLHWYSVGSNCTISFFNTTATFQESVANHLVMPLLPDGCKIGIEFLIPCISMAVGGRGGRGRNGRDKGRDQTPLTKEALDADLDEWQMRDKKHGGTSLDAELDDYWKNKEDDDPTDKDDGELLESAPADAPAVLKSDTPKSTKSAAKKSNGARALDRGNGEAPESVNNGA